MNATDTLAADYADGQAETVRGLDVEMRHGAWPREGFGEDLGDWIASDVLDYRITRDSAGELVAVSLLMTFGGPNAWWDVEGGSVTVRVYWGGDAAPRERFAPDLAPAILDYFEQVTA